MLASLRQKIASSLQRRISQAEIISSPAPMHLLCTAAITGLGHSSMALQQSNNDWDFFMASKAPLAESLKFEAASFKSSPAQKILALLCRIIALTSSIAPIFLNTSAISEANSKLTAFRASALAKVTVAM